MAELELLFHGFGVALSPFNLLLMFTGVLLGVIIGVLPGLGGANGVAMWSQMKPSHSVVR